MNSMGFSVRPGPLARFLLQFCKSNLSDIAMKRVIMRKSVLRRAAALALLASGAAGGDVITVGMTGCNYTSIQAALDAAKAGDEIRLRTQGFNENVNIARSLTIIGGYDSCSDSAPSQLTTITGPAGAGDSVIELTSTGITVELRRVVVNGGEDDGTGGGIDTGTNSTLTLGDVTVALNDSELGGGIYVGSSSTLRRAGNVIISNNSATRGGGIYAADSADIDFAGGTSGDITIESNSANPSGQGGGIWLGSGARFDMSLASPVEVTGNEALSGGGIYAAAGSGSNTTGLKVTDNLAASGGGIYAAGAGGPIPATATIILNLGNIADNQALSGGGIFLDDAGGHRMVMAQGSCQGNEAIDGGCISMQGPGRLYVSGSISGNNAARNGGGLYAEAGEIEVDSVFGGFENNTASSGGGAYVTSTDLVVRDTLIVSNTATNSGGGIRVIDGSLLLAGEPLRPVFFTENVSEQGSGGAIHIENGNLTADFARIGAPGRGNSALDGSGGGIHHAGDGNVQLVNTTVVGNSAGAGGGIHYAGAGRFGISAQIEPDGIAPARGSVAKCDVTRLASGRYCSEIRGNTAEFGGGINIAGHPSASPPHLIHGTALIGNAANEGSAIRANGAIDVWITTALVQGNRDNGAGPDVGVIRMANDTSILIAGSTIVDNRGIALRLSTMISLGNWIVDNIFYRNTADAQGYAPVSTNFDCNLSRDGTMPAEPGLDGVAPRFIETSRGPYRLSDLSPALDACGSGDGQDLDGLTRPMGAGLDAGAFEGAWGISEIIFADGYE